MLILSKRDTQASTGSSTKENREVNNIITMKNITKYIIYTRYGNKYEVTKDGYVIKYSNGLDKTNAGIEEIKSWQVLGLHEIKPFNQLGTLIPLSESITIKNFNFKNGKARYTIADKDYGTYRTVGNWNIHGVSSVTIL